MKKKSVWDNIDTGIEYLGTKITLPDTPEQMPIPKAISALQRKHKDENRVTDAQEIIEAYPLDAAVAFMTAMRTKYGWASPVPKMGFFGPEPPTMLSVKTGPELDDSVQCIWGDFKLPGVENPVSMGYTWSDGFPALRLQGELRVKDRAVLRDLANLTREILATDSIYRGKAIRLPIDSDGDINVMQSPEFLHTKHVKPEELVLSKSVADLVDTALLTPIRHTEECAKHDIPLKRGVLLYGPYGCGKSMTSSIVSKVAVEHDWTFILLDRATGLQQALQFAKRYQPAVVFTEDIDRVLEDRDDDANELLNTLDGVTSTDSKIMVVLTSNFPEKIDKAMLRPGRLDAVIAVTPPDAEAVERLIKIYGRGLLSRNITMERIGEKLAGEIPATIREVVERSKLAMIGAGRKTISEDNLIVTADGMIGHLSLLNADKVKKDGTTAENLGHAIEALIDETINPQVAGEALRIRHKVRGAVGSIRNQATAHEDEASMRHMQTGKKLDVIDKKITKITG